jgi:tRNA (guanine6-N2)-methyltransferase
MTRRFTARCVRGLEWVLAAEVAALGQVGDPRMAERQVSFCLPEPCGRVLSLRSADDLLLDIGTSTGIGPTRAALAGISQRVGKLDVTGAVERLRAFRPLPASPRFDVVASLLGRRSYNRYAAEDAAGNAIARVIGGRYVSRGTGTAGARPAADTDLTFRLFLHGPDMQVAVRIPGRPLHRREWKQATGPATLHPPVAAALARIATRPQDAVAGDPFCGDGTVPIELALAHPALRVLAADLDMGRLANARANAARAKALLGLACADAGHPGWRPGSLDLVISNPPWNRSVSAAGILAATLDPLWDRWPAVLSPRGRVCVVADAELDMVARLRRRGYDIALAQAIRLAGRISGILLATPPGAAQAHLPADLERWRNHAIEIGVLAPNGF